MELIFYMKEIIEFLSFRFYILFYEVASYGRGLHYRDNTFPKFGSGPLCLG